MPIEGERAVATCRQCGSALAVRIPADGSIRPIGTGSTCSCGGASFELVGDIETETGGDEIANGDDEREYPKP